MDVGDGVEARDEHALLAGAQRHVHHVGQQIGAPVPPLELLHSAARAPEQAGSGAVLRIVLMYSYLYLILCSMFPDGKRTTDVQNNIKRRIRISASHDIIMKRCITLWCMQYMRCIAVLHISIVALQEYCSCLSALVYQLQSPWHAHGGGVSGSTKQRPAMMHHAWG